MRLIQFEPLFIRNFTTRLWPFPLHNHNHYELILIQTGNGIHVLNGEKTTYEEGSVFFLSPEDSHAFMIHQETHFNVIKFLPGVLKGGINTSNTDLWNNLLLNLGRKFSSNSQKTASENIKAIINVMITEWEEHHKKVTEIHTHLLRSLLLIIDKKLREAIDTPISDYGITTIERIQNYLHAHICFPEKLSIKHMSNIFGMSESGFRIFFTKQMEMPLRDYMNSLKLQQIKERMNNSTSTLSQIAQDLGFTDSSHLNRFFKKQTQMNPLAYKKSQKTLK